MSPRRLRALFFAAALLLVLSFSRSALSAGHAVILQYHHFGDDTPPSTSVTLPQFTAHLDYLEKEGFTVWPVEKIVDTLQKKEPLPERCAGITIDDAYLSVYEKAWPLLKARGMPFTVFVPTGAADSRYSSSMTWEQMREMAKEGVDFAPHGHGHDYLVRRLPGEDNDAWARRVREDIERSRRRLREELGSESTLFAYPYGEYSAALQEIVRDLGLTGIAQQSGPLWEGSDFTALPRFPLAASFAAMDQFVDKVNSLPLPVLSAEPADPILPPGTTLPVLRLKIAPGDYGKESLACFVGGQGKIEAKWADDEGGVVEVVAHTPLPPGRSRYTCTARHRSEPRYFWYSHLWIRGGGEE